MGLPGDADVAELVDALDLGSSAERRGGSSPLIRTNSFISRQFAYAHASNGRASDPLRTLRVRFRAQPTGTK